MGKDDIEMKITNNKFRTNFEYTMDIEINLIRYQNQFITKYYTVKKRTISIDQNCGWMFGNIDEKCRFVSILYL